MRLPWIALVSLLAVTAGVALFRSCASPTAISPREVEAFNRWSQEHGKLYASPAESQHRLKVVVDNLRLVAQMNHDYNNALAAHGRPLLSSPMFGLMAWSDLETEEFLKQYTGAKFEEEETPLQPELELDSLLSKPALGQQPVKPYEYRIRNQGGCGSCWAHAAIAIIEKHYYDAFKVQIDFSHQQLVDCVHPQFQCGGNMVSGLRYMEKNGVARASSYPYIAAKGVCRLDKSTQITVPKIAPTDVAYSAKAVSTGIANGVTFGTGLPASKSFARLRANSEIFDITLLNKDECDIPCNHSVNVIDAGYNTVNGKKRFWVKIQNSWGKGWGNEGTIKVYPCSDTVLWRSAGVTHTKAGLVL